MNFLSIAAFLGFCSFNVETVVKEYHELQTEQEEIDFINKYSDCTSLSVMGYVRSIEMKQAEYRLNPVSRLAIFNRGKNALDKLIKEDPNNIHLRYVRLVLQEQLPKFLGYVDYIEMDKKFILGKLNIVDDSDYLDKYININTSL